MKKWLAVFAVLIFACSSASALEIPEVAPITMRSVDSADDAVAYAKEVWQYDFIAGYRDNLNWKAELIAGNWEIYADDAETGERALSLAIRPDRRIVYLLNVESGARQACDAGTDAYDHDEALLSDLEQFAIASFASLAPEVDANQLTLDSFREETNIGDSYFVDFWEPMPDGIEGKGNVHRHLYVQIAPEVRVTFWVDMLLAPPSDVWERLEPNMGNG
ncbi:MAG: hypothetical protein PUD16_05555 [bacterium]|nr:hypothetical protein [bacterium]